MKSKTYNVSFLRQESGTCVIKAGDKKEARDKATAKFRGIIIEIRGISEKKEDWKW